MNPTRRQLLAAIIAAPIVGRAAIAAAARSVPMYRYTSMCRWPFKPTLCTYATIRAAGRDYCTVAAWEADTDGDLIAADQICVGEVHVGGGSKLGEVKPKWNQRDDNCWRDFSQLP
jgi:hypothetical protein